jgi:hypothetical protein
VGAAGACRKGNETAELSAGNGNLIAEVEMTEEPDLGIRHDATGVHLPRAGSSTRSATGTDMSLGSESQPILGSLTR